LLSGFALPESCTGPETFVVVSTSGMA
jgi:hypothetical protein